MRHMIKGKDYENGSYLWKIYEGILLNKVSGEELEVNKIMVHSCGYCMKRFLVHLVSGEEIEISKGLVHFCG